MSDGKETEQGVDEMANEAKNMTSNVHAISKDINLDERRKNNGFVTRIALYTGFMNNPNEPTINGTNIIFAIVILAGVVYYIVNWGIGQLDEKDLERGKYAVMYDSAKRANAKVESEQKKRAEVLEYLKKKNLYSDLPEHLKTFESTEFDRMNLEQNKEK